jgi:hypothetical protein
MQLGQHYIQLFMSMALILTAAVVAFICDVLKRNNEQLREMNIELKTRQEEEQKRSHVPAPRAAERAQKTEKIAPPAPATTAPPMPIPKERCAVKNEKKRMVNSEAIAAMERGAALAGAGLRPRSAPVEPVRESKPEAPPATIVVSQPEPAASTKPVAVKKDWAALLSRNAQATKAPQALAVAGSTGFQTGFHDGFVLNKLVQSHQPISGLVVSIGVNASGKPEGVSKLVESLIGPNDFAAQSGEDEFLLIYPQEHGASAQRRLSQIAQQLWDFQLRSLGSFQILFSWGGVEVRSESLEEAIASASERMQETKRGRKLLTMELPAPEQKLRKAV